MSRSYQSSLDEKVSFNEKCFFEKRPYLKIVQVDFEGRAVTTSKYVEDDPANRYKNLKTSDFSLENQNLVGKNLPEVRVPISISAAEESLKSMTNGK